MKQFHRFIMMRQLHSFGVFKILMRHQFLSMSHHTMFTKQFANTIILSQMHMDVKMQI